MLIKIFESNPPTFQSNLETFPLEAHSRLKGFPLSIPDQVKRVINIEEQFILLFL